MTEPQTKTPETPPQRLMRLTPDFLQYSGIKAANTVYNMAVRGELRLVKIGRGTMVDLETFDALLERSEFTPGRKAS